MGLREKAVGFKNIKGEILVEIGYFKKECTEGKVRVEGGQEKKIG